MRHALMAEQKKSEIHEKIKSLTAECENLEEMVDQLNQDAVDMKKAEYISKYINKFKIIITKSTVH